jgi:hypothetical protein
MLQAAQIVDSFHVVQLLNVRCAKKRESAEKHKAVSPVNIMDRGISDFLCGLHHLWIVCKASLEALEELLHHLCGHAISYGLMRAEAVVVRLD